MGNHVKHVLFHLFSFVLVTGVQVVQGSPHHNHHHHRHHKLGFSKLFVFGDSYADTGNNRKSEASSWHQPYGITFPGKPVGRYSDGRVLTDYLASFVGIKSPVPYRWRNVATKRLRYGVNFAYGGTGVFDTLVPDPNMTTQIDFFQQLIHDGVYNKSNLNSSIALVSLAGNDYTTYMAKNGTAEGLSAFTISIINQLAINLKRIQGQGVKKVAVTAIEPIGCLPQSAASSSYQQCNETNNMAAMFHNLLLQQAVEKLNNETKGSTFMVLDLFNAFMSMFNRQKDHPGIMKFGNLLKPCCVGTSAEYSCGDIDENGVKKYTVCENPESTFFWDDVHPSQEGWHAVYSALQISLDQLYI
ncbi:PREDICTED: GDSL esterase/lipase At5g03610-like [Nelumbo nucifera]|uniref:GDSL esterase/lipase At5g03610-like n=1 Tax=Nelumbo nucifera TaxID=4432 RepID=A0A1U7Z120_NELNU|nr:PREDICTED: GDSL esterase/lipase At5g03610-like [Nelumbo nucifera]